LSQPSIDAQIEHSELQARSNPRLDRNAVKPAKFQYHAPSTVKEAIETLARYKGEARLLAGGQSLIPMMNFRLVTPVALIDLNQVRELSYVREENGTICIGAMTRHRQLETSDLVARKLPVLREAIGLIAHFPIRTRGTIGGSIANFDPAAELPMVLRLLDGQVVARGPNGQRSINASDLFVDLLTTSLASDEVLTEVRFPAMNPGAGYAVEEYARRKGDFAIAAVSAVAERAGKSLNVRLATAGVGAVPMRLTEAETILNRKGLTLDAIEEASRIASQLVQPTSDQQASADYRRHLIEALTSRALHRAASLL
jgi:CO/xanthine dehydrogenase FAD-binding subunit